MPANLIANKANVTAFYKMMFNDCRPREAIETYAGDVYIQHNPGVEDGKAGLIRYFEEAARDYPGKRVEVIRAFAEGSHVILHCRQDWPGDHTWAGIDIFRLDDAGRTVSPVALRPSRRQNHPVTFGFQASGLLPDDAGEPR